jgi:cytidylate kinase
MRITGISGPPCSGKDVAAEHLSNRYDYVHISTGDLLRAKARELNISLGRSSLQLLGSRLRIENGGNDPLLENALKNIRSNTVFTGIRTVNAAKTILSADSGHLIYVDALLYDRYKRSTDRAWEELGTFDEFVAQDTVEHLGGIGIDTSLTAIKALASKIIFNNTSLTDYLHQIDDFVIQDIR